MTWSNWENLGGNVESRPSVINNSDGRLEVFARGVHGDLKHKWQTTDPHNPWSNEVPLNGDLYIPAIAARNADGRLEVFTVFTGESSLMHKFQIRHPDYTEWSEWYNLAGDVKVDGGIAVINNMDDHGRLEAGRLEVFVMSNLGQTLDHIWQTNPSSGWSRWESLGGSIDIGPKVASNGDGRLEVFARGIDGDMRHIRQTGASSNPWNGAQWESLGSPSSIPIPEYDIGIGWNYPDSTHPYGRLEVFIVTNNGHDLWHTWET